MQIKNTKERRAQWKRYREIHKEFIKQQKKEYRKKHKKEIKKYNMNYRKKNRERIKGLKRKHNRKSGNSRKIQDFMKLQEILKKYI
jgi:hypothetical protein